MPKLARGQHSGVDKQKSADSPQTESNLAVGCATLVLGFLCGTCLSVLYIIYGFAEPAVPDYYQELPSLRADGGEVLRFDYTPPWAFRSKQTLELNIERNSLLTWIQSMGYTEENYSCGYGFDQDISDRPEVPVLGKDSNGQDAVLRITSGIYMPKLGLKIYQKGQLVYENVYIFIGCHLKTKITYNHQTWDVVTFRGVAQDGGESRKERYFQFTPGQTYQIVLTDLSINPTLKSLKILVGLAGASDLRRHRWRF